MIKSIFAAPYFVHAMMSENWLPKKVCRKIAWSHCRNFACTLKNSNLSELCLRLFSTTFQIPLTPNPSQVPHHVYPKYSLGLFSIPGTFWGTLATFNLWWTKDIFLVLFKQEQTKFYDLQLGFSKDRHSSKVSIKIAKKTPKIKANFVCGLFDV